MLKQVMSAGVTAFLLGVSPVAAAPIDLDALNLQTTTPLYNGGGDIIYDAFLDSVFTDFSPTADTLSLDDFATSEINLSYDFSGPFAIADVFYETPFGDFQNLDIVAFGFTDDTLEFLLTEVFADLSNGTTGVGSDAILRISSQSFDFSGTTPSDFFMGNADPLFGQFRASTQLTLQALETKTAPPVPLPATLPLLLLGLGGIGVLVRRRT